MKTYAIENKNNRISTRGRGIIITIGTTVLMTKEQTQYYIYLNMLKCPVEKNRYTGRQGSESDSQFFQWSKLIAV